MIEKLTLLYEGKAKKIFATTDPRLVIVHFKDDATAYNAQKKGVVKDKGIVNNEVTSMLYSHLEENGIKTHFRKKLNDREQLCEKVNIIPIEVIVRNLVAGSMAKRLSIEEGTLPINTILEICYKNDALNDPLINDHHAVAMNLVTYETLEEIYKITRKINEILKVKFASRDIILVDTKFEFGTDASGNLMLADEISPDTCRLWDKTSRYKLDKDRFRRDLGQVEEAYQEVLNRLKGI